MKVGLNPDDAKLILRYLDGQLTEMENMDDEDILEEGESWWDRRHEILRLMANLRAAIAEAEPQGYDAEGNYVGHTHDGRDWKTCQLIGCSYAPFHRGQ